MARGVDGRDIFIDDHDRHGFLSAMDQVKRQANAEVFAYCLMGNHFHLAVKVGSVALASVMQRILTGYVLTFNAKYERTGHLFQARYKSNLCLHDRYLTALIRYIHLNPVRAGFTALPEEWPWSSYLEYRESGRDGLVGTDEDYPDFDPWDNHTEEPAPDLIRMEGSPMRTLEELCAPISAKTGIGVAEIRSGSKRSEVVAAKRLLIEAAIPAGYRLSNLAEYLGSTPGAISHYLRKSNCGNYKPDT